MQVRNESGRYFTELVTANAIGWLEGSVRENASRPTFAYLAHESNHAPMEVPMSWIAEGCLKIPPANPTRRMLCGMMRAVDSSVHNMTGAYKRLGLWEQTVVIFSTDNGGNTDTGGNNSPLRGNKVPPKAWHTHGSCMGLDCCQRFWLNCNLDLRFVRG